MQLFLLFYVQNEPFVSLSNIEGKKYTIDVRIVVATSLFNHVGSLCGAYVGDRITISDSTGTTHSVLVIGSGSNSSSINTKSKLGSAGVYGAPLTDYHTVCNPHYPAKTCTNNFYE